MSDAFRPTPSTDALDTLGKIHEFAEKRDAIHLGVEPVIAGEKLLPGCDIGIGDDGKAYAANVKFVGIADPFLRAPIMVGQRFWLVVYPREIRSLRHVWEHPDFPSAIETQAPSEPVFQPTSEQMLDVRRMVRDPDVVAIDQIANDLEISFDELMKLGDDAQDGEEYFYHPRDAGKWEGTSLPSRFWQHYAALKGKELSSLNTDAFLTCSC